MDTVERGKLEDIANQGCGSAQKRRSKLTSQTRLLLALYASIATFAEIKIRRNAIIDVHLWTGL